VGDGDAATGLEGAEVGRIFREESGRSLAALIRAFGDIDVAEDAVQEAFASPWAGGPTTAYRPILAAGSPRPPQQCHRPPAP
jgi:predicted RNA polymerase sigma factor